MLTIGAIGRFHFLEQARAVARQAWLHRIYCDDPRVVSQVGISRGRWLAREGLAARWSLFAGASSLTWRGARLAQATAGAPLVKLNSAFALEALRSRGGEGIWVDHGSLDERQVARHMRREAELWGDPLVAAGGNHSAPEILARQAEEFDRAEGVVVASELARHSLIAEGVAPAKIHVVPLGVDPQRFRPAAPQTDWASRQVFRILHAGPVTFNKGVHRLIEAFRQGRWPRTELWIVGHCPDERVRARLSEQARGLAVQFRPAVAQSALPDLFSQCDLLVLASLADGFGLTVLQAMACGLPAIVTRQAGCAEVLAGCPAAQIVPAADSEALQAALGEAIERGRDARLAGPTRQQARQWASLLNWDQHAAKLRAVLSVPSRRRAAVRPEAGLVTVSD